MSKNILRRVEPSEVEQVYRILKANEAAQSSPVDNLTLSDFNDSYFSISQYFWYGSSEFREDATVLLFLGGMDVRSRSAEFGVTSLEGERRKGNGSSGCFALFRFAFQTIGLNRLYCIVNADNDACGAMINKFDGTLTLEGTLRQSRFKNGVFIDQHIYSILASEKHKWDMFQIESVVGIHDLTSMEAVNG